ncbi:MAG: hypothetical protein EBR09_16050 [Proteobacteria bacterium]|jgi:hypothetical protein|nr:hypothetical protein [Pseudomonadota bacterium]
MRAAGSAAASGAARAQPAREEVMREEFMRTGGAAGPDPHSLTAEERGRHNFERMLAAMFGVRARAPVQAG